MNEHSVNLFFAAMKESDYDTMADLLSAEPDLINARNGNGATAIQVAVYSFNRPVAEWLVRAGAEMDLPSACCVGDLDFVANHAREADINELSPDGFCLLALAAAFGGPEIVTALLRADADVNLRSTALGGVAAIHAAIFARQNDSLRVLLENGADPDMRQEGGFTPLMGAAQNGDQAAVQLLLDFGADRSVVTDDGKTAADWAKASGHQAIVDLLAP